MVGGRSTMGLGSRVGSFTASGLILGLGLDYGSFF